MLLRVRVLRRELDDILTRSNVRGGKVARNSCNTLKHGLAARIEDGHIGGGCCASYHGRSEQ